MSEQKYCPCGRRWEDCDEQKEMEPWTAEGLRGLIYGLRQAAYVATRLSEEAAEELEKCTNDDMRIGYTAVTEAFEGFADSTSGQADRVEKNLEKYDWKTVGNA
jgi:hypothetical protein